jgi:ligand-binding SRPBCC domain-containing protein
MTDVSIERHPAGGYRLRAESFVPRPRDEVFAFFSDAANLERLTPPWLRFHILTPMPIAMAVGRLIDYRLRIRGAPVRWQSEITAWNPPHDFADEARRGPYKFWRHQHRFVAEGEGTRVYDDVHYDVPGGRLVHWLLVGRDVRKIFEYRQRALAEIFPPPPARRAVPTQPSLNGGGGRFEVIW